MSKYEKISVGAEPASMEDLLAEGEELLWSGKPKKSAFILNKSLRMMPFALLWLAFDSFFLITAFSGGVPPLFLIPFFAFHLMPVWIWLSNVVTARKRWSLTQYGVTNRRILIQTGFLGMNYVSLFYKEITNVRLQVGVVDRLLHVGDIYFDVDRGSSQCFLDVEHVYELYPKIQKIVLDIQTDMEYPNDLRPEENHGYRTGYKG